MRRHTVAISDIHLCELERTNGLWMRYRQAPYTPDRELVGMLDALRERVRGEELHLVLNGDTFDFDAPRVVNGESVFHDLPRTAEHALPALRAILDDHPGILAALGRVLADGHWVVFVSGNHDVQLTLPEVRAQLAARLADAAVEASPGCSRDRARARVAFRAWFHETADGIVVEHGHQYDAYCCYRHPMAPFDQGDKAEIPPTMGSLSTRLLISRMGYFNPHVDTSYMLSAYGYVAHWARYYLFSRRSIAMAFAGGAARTVVELARRRLPFSRARRRQDTLAAARETGSPLTAVARHARLFASPAGLQTVMRELWIDRIAVAGVMLLLGAGSFVASRGPMLAGLVIAPTLFATYEVSVPKKELDDTWRSVQRTTRLVARAHRARAVVLGHTHHAEGVWDDGVFYGNTGSWSPAYKDIACTQPLTTARPLVWLQSDGGALSGGLVMWEDGRFSPS